MTRFKEALLEQLLEHQQQMRVAGPAKASRAPRRTAVLAAAGAGALAVAAVATWAALPARTPHPSPPALAAYTVTPGDDDIVSFTVRRVVDPAAATRDLRAAGIDATVLNASAPGTCPTSLDSLVRIAGGPAIGMASSNNTISLSRGSFGGGPLLVVVAPQAATSIVDVVVLSLPVSGPAPDCVSVGHLPAFPDTSTAPAADPTPTR